MANDSQYNKSAELSKPPLVVVVLGPTASGKTSLGISLAKQLQLEVLNVDSRQLYRDMNVGTAKPTPDQQRQVAHQLIDLRAPDEPITLQEFQSIAMAAVTQSIAQSRMALLVGGSGLYLKSLIKGLRPPGVAPQPGLRQQLQHLGQAICHPLLRQADPAAAKRIAPADSMRTQRALEVLYATGRPISAQQGSIPPNWRVLELGLDPADLRDRIALRTGQLYANGLIEETERLCSRYSADLPLLQTIGYREALQIIQGQLNREQAIALTTRRTQQFAKRQRTWFRRQHHPYWLKGEEPLSEALSLIQAGLR
ncbi:tRNA (adenosine(37)-N6)-dimethylallyltransferase MiaA [Prochlorococcus sp. MIT 1201]|uniref:tRNA (adenosine(37)-N6)-dimethylallyltransferase MiaA n=1 Tax=Prochlorococcus sp. MIT 1201 TaxID=3082535 RepID=UPI0039A553BA